jgi:hypothetical protein
LCKATSVDRTTKTYFYQVEAGRWFSPGTPVSSTNETDRHDITEISLKVALNTIALTLAQMANQGAVCPHISFSIIITQQLQQTKVFYMDGNRYSIS